MGKVSRRALRPDLMRVLRDLIEWQGSAAASGFRTTSWTLAAASGGRPLMPITRERLERELSDLVAKYPTREARWWACGWPFLRGRYPTTRLGIVAGDGAEITEGT
jgi:hypothetical protein